MDPPSDIVGIRVKRDEVWKASSVGSRNGTEDSYELQTLLPLLYLLSARIIDMDHYT